MVDELERKYWVYRALYTDHQDQHGFILSSHCDSLLFTGLLGGVLPEGIDIKAAEKSPGEWTRRPLVDGEDTCYPDNSKSTISRDMLLGLQFYAWKNQRLDILEDLWDYGKANTWIMGKGAPSRIIFTPNSQALLAEAIFRLGGEDHFITRAIPTLRNENTGFQAHLDHVSILLSGELEGEISGKDLEIMAGHVKRVPDNALVRYIHSKYTDGIQDAAIKSLLNESWFPRGRLPTTTDRKSGWLWERDPGADWSPRSGAAETHTGGDFLLVAHLILKDLGRLD